VREREEVRGQKHVGSYYHYHYAVLVRRYHLPNKHNSLALSSTLLAPIFKSWHYIYCFSPSIANIGCCCIQIYWWSMLGLYGCYMGVTW
jgi:hypothetical protein